MPKISDLLDIKFPDQPNPKFEKNENKIRFNWEAIIFEIWYSKKNRSGKGVSLLKIRNRESVNIEDIRIHLINLLKKLKKKFNCGGSVKNGEIILQYRNREDILAFLKSKSVKSIISGGN